MGKTPRILVADDNADVHAALRLLLRLHGMEGRFASSPAEALDRLDGADALLMDMNYTRDTTSGREGVALLEAVRARDPSLPVVIMTAWGSVEGAVECMRLGVADYVTKPWQNEPLALTLRNAVELGRARRTSALLSAENERLRGDQTMVADSPAMQPVVRLLERVAPSDATVLITGEHGTGKEVTARFLHDHSARRDAPFAAVHAGSVADGVFESEMFGHVKGAFTDARTERRGAFAQADGGTLFLDEIGTMPAGQQAKLLRALETGEISPVGSSRRTRVDVRLVAATNADLDRDARAGTFREDLLYRINTVVVRLPPLRDRPDDIPALAARALDRWSRRRGRPYRLAPSALTALLAHPWPGNVRELQHALERAVLLAPGDLIEADDLGLRAPAERPATPSLAPPAGFDDMTLEQAERALIERALARTAGNVNEAAVRLGLSRSALYRRLARFGLGGDAGDDG